MPINFIKQGTLDHFSALVIGRPGVGKTSLVRSIPEDEPTLILSAESGLLCIRDLVDSGQVTAIDITCMEDCFDIMDALNTKEWMDAYKWVVVDSLSEIATICQRYAEKKIPDKSATFAMWDLYKKTMNDIVKGFRDMPHYHSVVVCLEKATLNEVNQRFIGPDVPHKTFAEKLPSILDEVLYMTLDQDGNRILLTQPGTLTPGKDRSGKLDAIEQPNLMIIRDKILKGTS